MPVYGPNQKRSPAVTDVASFTAKMVLDFLEDHGRMVVAAGGKLEETATCLGLYLYAWKLHNSLSFVVRPFEDYVRLVNLLPG
jgi:hypothetical protein